MAGLRIVIESEYAGGKSSLAAVIVKALQAYGLPVTLVDSEPEYGDAAFLLAEPDRLRRNLLSIAGREIAAGGTIEVVTRQLAPEPTRHPDFKIAGTETFRHKHAGGVVVDVDPNDPRR